MDTLSFSWSLRKGSQLFTVESDIAVGLSYIAFLMLMYVSSTPTLLRVFFFNHKWMLNFLLISALRFYLESLSLAQVYTNIYLYIVYKNLTYQFIQSFIHLCNKHLLNTYTLGIILNAGNKATNKTKFLATMELYSKRNMIIQDII